MDRVNGKIDIADCEHDPPCLDTEKTGLEDLKVLITELKEHQANLKDTPAPTCPFEFCRKRERHSSHHALILHLCNKHSPGPSPPLVGKELGWKCPQCKTWLIAGESIKIHMDKAANGLDCAGERVARGTAFNARTRSMIGESRDSR